MATRYGWPAFLTLLALALVSVPAQPISARQAPGAADFDIRDIRPPASPRPAGARTVGASPGRLRVNRESGTLRVVDAPGLSIAAAADATTIRELLGQNAHLLGLEAGDLANLEVVRDFVSRSNAVRHVVFRQAADGLPVFDSSIAVHLGGDGTLVRITSNASSLQSGTARPAVTPASARAEAEQYAPGTAAAPSLTWLPMDGALTLAWHATVSDSQGAVRDLLIDATSGGLLLRRNRTRDAQGQGRVLQSSGTASLDPRRPDAMPLGPGGACPPPANYELRSLDAPFRDPATVLSSSGTLAGNNAMVFRGAGGASATGTTGGGSLLFDFPFNSAASAETFLFFAANFTHDFFYDLGFDESAGNFQADNFGRGGAAGDPLRVNARAPGRNNATYTHAADGASPTINMFLWDGTGCWAADVDSDGTPDLDADYDLDVLVHEFHHGVSLRLNTAFTGNEAGAIGEGGGDFFAYSVNDDATLAEYARPGGLRRVNGKGYADWTCLLGLFCEVHDNGEIWANVLWDVRQRFRADLVRSSLAAATNEVHQLYVDSLMLSPPAPTMLDMRDAMLLADEARNGRDPVSDNYCRLWESFAARGMGVSALDTADSGLNRVTAAYDVPAGCVAPPGPAVVTIVATIPTASEAQAVPGQITINRGEAGAAPLTVYLTTGGSATSGLDYVALDGATIPAGATSVVVPVVPIDDAAVEQTETISVGVRQGPGYIPGAAALATVTLLSDDVAADLVVTAVSVPAKGAAGAAIAVTDTTRNQGTGGAGPTQVRFFLSRNALLDTSDAVLGSRTVDDLPVSASSVATTSLTLPALLEAGTYYVFAKADAENALVEISESNNTRADSIAIGPDLTVTALTGPQTAAAGGSFLVSDTTTNPSEAVAPASTTRFYLSANSLFDAGDVALQSRTVPELAAGGSSAASITVTVPTTTATGTYYLLARADADLSVAELNELNNTRAIAVRIGPDLAVSALSASARAAAGGQITITDTTRNTGSGPAAPSTTAFYLSSNSTLDSSDLRLSPFRPVGPLAAGDFSTATSTASVPEVAAGTWYLLASADDGQAVVETQETNNGRATSVLVGPDLLFQGVTTPSKGIAGGTITAVTTVKNAGAAAAGPSSVRFYLSTNLTLDGSDVQLDAVRAVPTLAPDGSHSASTVLALPAGSTGTFYLLMTADADGAVAEANESNNVVVRGLQITGP